MNKRQTVEKRFENYWRQTSEEMGERETAFGLLLHEAHAF